MAEGLLYNNIVGQLNMLKSIDSSPKYTVSSPQVNSNENSNETSVPPNNGTSPTPTPTPDPEPEPEFKIVPRH